MPLPTEYVVCTVKNALGSTGSSIPRPSLTTQTSNSNKALEAIIAVSGIQHVLYRERRAELVVDLQAQEVVIEERRQAEVSMSLTLRQAIKPTTPTKCSPNRGLSARHDPGCTQDARAERRIRPRRN